MYQKQPRPSTAKKFNLPPPSDNIEDYMKTLYDHQKVCEKTGKYLEADQAKKKLIELKAIYEQRSKSDIRDRHEQEKFDLIKAHEEEMLHFNQFWDGKRAEFEEEAKNLRDQLTQKQELELNQFYDELEGSIPQTPKDSAELLSLRKSEQQLAKQELYLEAHQTQLRIHQLQKEEQDKWSLQRNTKIKNLIQQLKTKQQSESNALNQRINAAQEEQKKMRYIEEEKIVQKFQNMCKEIESQQQNELYKMDKNFKTASILSISKQSKMQSSQQEEFIQNQSPQKQQQE